MDLEVYVPPLLASIPELKVRIRTVVTLREEFLQLDFLAKNRRNIGASDCITLVNLGMMQRSRVM